MRRRTFLGWAAAVGGACAVFRPAWAMKAEEVAIGHADAPVTVVEYASLTCPHCAHFHVDILPILEKRYIEPGKVRWVFRDFPLDRFALMAAMLAHCAGPERYPAFVSVFFETQQQWTRARDPLAALRSIAKLGGLTDEQMDACLADRELLDSILQMRLEGQQTYGVDSTPSFLVAGKLHAGAIEADQFAKLLDPLLQ